MIEATYSTQKAFELYQNYLALKNHFNGKGDYFKYNGKVRVKQETFDTRKDRFSFYKLSKDSDAFNRLLACISENPSVYIRDIVDNPKCNATYKAFIKRNQSLSYSFQQDLKKLGDITDAVTVKNDQTPYALRLYYQDEISLETLIILDTITGVFSYWNEEITDTVIWPELNKKCSRYRPFMSYNLSKMKGVMKKVIEDNL